MKKKKVKLLRFIPLILLISLVTIFFIQSQFKQTGNIIETSQSEKTTAYIYGNGLVASYDSNGEEKFYINDHLGGTSVVLDENGNKIGEESYYAFGEEKSSTGNERLTYTGKEKDASGLYYYGARYYDADSGRFIQPDPISGSLGNPQSLNRYVYVLNNPNKYVDPSGMDEEVYGPPTPTLIKIGNNVRSFLENEERLGNEAGGIAGWMASRTASSLKLWLVSTNEEQAQWFQENIENGGFAGISGGMSGFSDDIARAITKADAAFGGKIKRILFRGDDNVKPEEAFEKGIIAGTNKKITPDQHTWQTQGQAYFDDPWKSATTNENVAAFFAGDRGYGYVYYLAETKGRTLKISKAGVGIADEAEVLFKGTIKPNEIVGARKVINLNYRLDAADFDDVTNIESVTFGDFIPNHRYKE